MSSNVKKRFLLNKSWYLKPFPGSKLQLKKRIPAKGIPVSIPGTVHSDLIQGGFIDDPFLSDNEIQLQWIDDLNWIYETNFDLPADISSSVPVMLVFEGLDTVAEIKLNGVKVGMTDNMFRQYDIDISSQLKQQNNELQVIFTSARRYVSEIKKPLNQFPSARHPDRVFIRKAQYSFGWDWGPAFPTCGIWRPVYLSQTTAPRIQSVRFTTLRISKNTARVKVEIEIDGKIGAQQHLQIRLEDLNQSFRRNVEVTHADQLVSTQFRIRNPNLWWPNGMGIPHLYNLEVVLRDSDDHPVDICRKKVGIRTIKLEKKNDKKDSFRFIVNAIPLFIKGANWIPADSFLNRVDEQIYRDLLVFARDAHMNMIRVWGGGIYENDIFYHICDELGLLVWQDFMFACAAYPEHSDFVTNVTKEVKQNVLRLQHHPSVAIWCGNNENEWIWYRDGCGKIKDMPGYSLFHVLIPQMLLDLDPKRPYWPTTPFGKEDDPNSAESGNRHVWDIWSRWIDYSEVRSDNSLFVSEFGFQAPARIETLRKVISKSEMKPHSRIFEFHNKQDEGPERLTRFLAGHFPITTQIDDYIYLTQLNQGLALKTCLEHWRLNWPGTGGSIIWQLNDCWPVSSWSLIDSNLLPKIAWYFVKRAFDPVLLCFKCEKTKIVTFLSNLSNKHLRATVVLSVVNTAKGSVTQMFNYPVKSNGQTLTRIAEIEKTPDLVKGKSLIIASLIDNEKGLVQRNYYVDTRWKYLKMSDPAVQIIQLNDKTGKTFRLHAKSLALFVYLEHEKLQFADNGLILLPNEQYDIVLQKGRLSEKTVKNIKIKSLNNFLH